MTQSFAMTTRQAAKAAGVEPYVIYAAMSRKGHWRGIYPVRLENGRMIWRADHVRRAVGLIPDYPDNIADAGERALLRYLSDNALPLTADAYKLGLALLNQEPDHGCDPSTVVDEADLVVPIVMGWCERLTGRLSSLGARDKKRARAALNVISSTALAHDWEGADHDD